MKWKKKEWPSSGVTQPCVFFIYLFIGLRLRWWCQWWKWRRKTAIPTHKHPTRFVFCAVGVVFVLEIVWIEKFVGIVCGYCLNWKVCFLILEEWRRWWVWADGGVVYPKKTKKKNRIAERCVRCVPDPAWKTKKEKEKKITCVGKSKRSDRGTLNVFLITKMPLETEF